MDRDLETLRPVTITRNRDTAQAWHALEPDRALQELQSDRAGLSATEARRRLEVLGPNALASAPGEGALVLLWRQINSPLIWVLITAAALAVMMGKTVDGMVVFGVVVLNTLIGFFQEFRAGRAIDALIKLVPDTATVLRDGERRAVPATEVVAGDVIALHAGDKVPADLRLLSVRNLQIEEAALTGESVPAIKRVAAVAPDAGLGDRCSMAYGGTLVTTGTGLGVVVATGGDTELGRISALLREATELETPLTRQLATVARWLTVAIVVVSLLLMAVGLLRGYPLAEAFLAAITLAVAAIPEGLPAIMTIALAVGVQRMARRRAVIRRLPAVETLGSTTVICSDKTGTLTRNEMTVKALWTPQGSYELDGVGYAPVGQLYREGRALPTPPSDVLELLRAGTLCNDATLRHADGAWHISGDPTEGALVVAARKGGIDEGEIRRTWERLDAVPFESERQFMATLHRVPTGGQVELVKGAPEVVLRRCAVRSDGSALNASGVLEQVDALASRGMRVLAIAARQTTALTELRDEDLEDGLVLLGLQGMIDPPRAEAIEAVRACRNAGIEVKMITGDHRVTAEAIGRELGLLNRAEEAVSGAELATLSDADLRTLARRTKVFARVAPEHKLRLVRALQADGQVVAMTGDGVNDAPALKQANIGVAMGITGTAVSKEAAGVVLTDDNFASIEAAVEEGRRVYDNLIKSLAFVLPTNLGLALIMVAAVLLFPIVQGQPLLPMTATQILWINLVATVALALPLAFEAMEPDVMRRAPRAPAAPVLSEFVLARTLLVALLMAAGALGLFLYEYSTELARGVAADVALREAQTMAVTTVILFQIFYLLNCRSLRDSILRIGLWSNPSVFLGIAGLIALQLGFIYLPVMQSVFGTAALNADALVKALLVALIVVPVISVEKWLRQRGGELRTRGRTAA